jgi:hypothetical protein
VPRKKSIKKSANDFIAQACELESFVNSSINGLSDMQKSWCYDYAIIRLYREFEQMILSAIVGAINNDSATISISTGVEFPKHLTDEVCEYLVLGGRYFDFKGRDGLIKTLKNYVPDTHYLVVIVKKTQYKDALEKLSALRNYAAHESNQSKRSVLKAIGQQRVASAGSWLKLKGRYVLISTNLKQLAEEVRDNAPY